MKSFKEHQILEAESDEMLDEVTVGNSYNIPQFDAANNSRKIASVKVIKHERGIVHFTHKGKTKHLGTKIFLGRVVKESLDEAVDYSDIRKKIADHPTMKNREILGYSTSIHKLKYGEKETKYAVHAVTYRTKPKTHKELFDKNRQKYTVAFHHEQGSSDIKTGLPKKHGGDVHTVESVVEAERPSEEK